MKKSSIHICPMSFGKAIALTNFIFAILAIAVVALVPGVDMKSSAWKIAMAFPFLFGLAGLVYGYIGGSIYNISAKDKGEHPGIEVREEQA